MAFLVHFWALRLTHNFKRKGGYGCKKKDEDYRYVVQQHACDAILCCVFT
jgi:steroid 5-alpha reductase family enzyme